MEKPKRNGQSTTPWQWINSTVRDAMQEAFFAVRHEAILAMSWKDSRALLP
jgi:hypothetical protein